MTLTNENIIENIIENLRDDSKMSKDEIEYTEIIISQS